MKVFRQRFIARLFPDRGENFSPVEALLLKLVYQSKDASAESVDLCVRVRPWIDQQFFIERTGDGSDVVQFEKTRIRCNQQAQRKLDAGDAFDQFKISQDAQQVAIAVDRCPWRKCEKRRLQREP